MAGRQDTLVKTTLTTAFSDLDIERRAHAHGVVKRKRKFDIVVFVWALMLSFRAGARRTLESVRRSYQHAAGQTIARSSFYERFTPALAEMLRQMANDLLESMTRTRSEELRTLLRGFADVLCIDATVIALRAALSRRFPACHDDAAAAIKLHAVMSAVGGSPHRIKLSGQRTADNAMWRRLGGWVEGCLLLFDLGYYDFNLFHRIEQRGGFFLTRLKSNANPMIVAQHRRHRGRARDLEGCTLLEAIEGLHRSHVDVQVAFDVPLRGGRVVSKTWRVVGILNAASGEYHLYVTNVPTRVLAADDVGRLYAVRWQVELLFKLMKSHGGLDELTSRKWEVVESMLWACVLQVLMSQKLRLALLRRVKDALVLPPLRFQEVFGTYALLVLMTVTSHRCSRRVDLDDLMLHEAPDPNITRLRGVDACFAVPTI